MNLCKRLINDERGVIASAELIFLSTILILGTIVGLATMRDSIVNELGDLSSAVGNLNQSYSISSTMVGGFLSAGSEFLDMSDFCELGDEEGDNNNDVANAAPGCIVMNTAAEEEGN